MFAKLGKVVDLRLATTIAAGVGGGLVAYRLFMGVHAWFVELDGPTQQSILAVALLVAAICAASYGAWRLINRCRNVRAERQSQIPQVSPVRFLPRSRRAQTYRALVFGAGIVLAAFVLAAVSGVGR